MNSSITISLVQTPLHWEDRQANLKMLEEKIFSIKDKPELVILPEMFSTGFSMNPSRLAENMNGETVSWMRRVAAAKKIILTGSVIIEEDGNYYNRLIWMLPNGEFGIYDKRHRFAFAGEDKFYEAGDKRVIASVKGWKVNLQICYDLRFPVWARQASTQPPPKGEEQGNPYHPEYDLLVYVANWPEKRIHAWKTLLMARAIENQCFVAGVNRVGEDGNGIVYSGDSMIVDPLGEILVTGNEEKVYTLTIDKEHLNTVREKLPFLKDADEFKLIVNS